MRARGATWLVRGGLLGLILAAGSCSGAEEAPEYDVAIYADGSGLTPVETDLGAEVTVEEIRFWIDAVEFTVGGEEDHEAQASLFRRWVIPVAHAHPGHGVGGEVAGELLGPLEVVLRPGESERLGTGLFLGGRYAGYNLRFSLTDGDGEPLEHHVLIRGAVTPPYGPGGDGEPRPFEARLQLFPGAEIRGGAFTGRIPAVEALGLRVLTYDEWSETTLFDGVDFSGLPAEEGVLILRGTTAAGAILLNRFLAHEFYDGVAR